MKAIINFILVSFVLSGITAGGYAGESSDKLRPSAAADVKIVKFTGKAETSQETKKISTPAEMRWEMVKQSALYFNNNLALTGVEARSSSLSNGDPTVEARFILKSRGGREIVITGEAASGASAGNREALFLFDRAFAKKAEKKPDMLTDAMIADIYGKGVDRKEALRRLRANNGGKGVEITLWIARNVLIPELTKAIKEGKIDPAQRYSVDGFMREYEKTHGGDERQKLKLTGANTTAFSTAAAKLGAAFNNMETWEFLSYRPDPKSLKVDYKSFGVLIPIAVLIEGGAHGGWNTDWQEYMVEVRGNSFEEITQKLKNITNELEKIMEARGESIGVGMESAYMPKVTSNTEPIEMIVQAGKNFGYQPGKDFAIALDLASSEFYREYEGKYYYSYKTEGRNNKQITLRSGKTIGKLVDIQEEGEKAPTRFLLLTSEEQLEWALDICKNPENFISSVEDFFDQNDLWGNMMLTRTLQDKNFIASLPHEFQKKDGIHQDAISHVADDFTTSNIEVVKAAIDGGKVIFEGETGKEELALEKDSVDAVLLKLNQAGTVQEIMELVEYLRGRGRTIAHSHRGKEPSKETIRADVALASTTYPSILHDRTGAPAKVKIKYGSIRKERAVVYDYLRGAYAKIAKKIEESKIGGAKEAAAIPTVTSGIDSIISLVSQEFKIPEAKISGYLNADRTSFDALGGKELMALVDSVKTTAESDVEKIVKEFNGIIAPGLQGRNFDLRINEDYEQVLAISSNSKLSKITSDFVISRLLPAIKENFSKQEAALKANAESKNFEVSVKYISDKVVQANWNFKGTNAIKNFSIKQTASALIVNADFFELAGATNALLETVNLLGTDRKLGLYGETAKKLRTLLGNNDNIVISDTLDTLITELGGQGVEPDNIVLARAISKDGEFNPQIKQVVFTKEKGMSTIILAKSLRELFNSNAVNAAFDKFYQNLTVPAGENRKEGVISKDAYERTKEHMNAFKAGSVFYLPDIELTGETSKQIETEAEAVKIFIFEFATKG